MNNTKFPSFKDAINEQQNSIVQIVPGYLAQIESNWNPRAVSPRGARGIMQIHNERVWNEIIKDMRKPEWTWEEYSFDRNVNIAVGTHYVNVMIPRYLRTYGIPDTIETRLAAYNWGIGNLRNAYQRFKDAWKSKAPRETINHINRYMNLLNR